MVINKKRRRRKGRMPAALARYWATHRRARRRRNDPDPRRRRRYVRVRHVYANPRRHRRRRVGRGGGGGVPSTIGGFISVRFLTEIGFAGLGVLAPSLVTDKFLPMLGLTFTGWTRRLVQFAVPVAVVLIGGKRLLGRGATPFVIGAGAAVVVGVVNDVTGGVATVGRYALPAPVVGRYQRPPAVLYTR